MLVSRTITSVAIQPIQQTGHFVLVQHPIQLMEIPLIIVMCLFAILVLACLHAGSLMIKRVVAQMPSRRMGVAKAEIIVASVLI